MPDYTDEIAFITKCLAKNGQFVDSGRGSYFRAAKRMIKADPTLHMTIEADERLTGLPVYRGGRHVGWGGSRVYRGNWSLRR